MNIRLLIVILVLILTSYITVTAMAMFPDDITTADVEDDYIPITKSEVQKPDKDEDITIEYIQQYMINLSENEIDTTGLLTTEEFLEITATSTGFIGALITISIGSVVGLGFLFLWRPSHD